MNCFEVVGKKLEKWALRVKGTRGRAIADVTIDAINDLSGYFELPKGFTNFIEEFRIREGALQSLVDYRDHFIHPFHVFCLGYFILNKWEEENWRGLPDLLDEQDRNLSLKRWFVTSIYHDVGYPSEKFEVLVMEFFKTSVGREIRSQFDWSSVLLANDNLRHIDELSSLFVNKAIDKKEAEAFKKWFCKRLVEDHDHGVLTALILLNQDKIEWKRSDLKMVNEAALAIALHNWRRDPMNSREFDLGQLPVEDFSLAFFLSYCDTAQEWGRRVLLELMKKGNTSMTIPNVTKLDSTLAGIIVKKQDTTVIIKYPSKFKDVVRENETLQDVFNGIKIRFQEKWCLRKDETMKLMIEGKDKDYSGIGSFGAEIYGEKAFEEKRRMKVEGELSEALNQYIVNIIWEEIKNTTEFEELVKDILIEEEEYYAAEEKLLRIFDSLTSRPKSPAATNP